MTLTKRIQMMIWICDCTIRPPPGATRAAPDWLIFGAIVNTERNQSVHVSGRRWCMQLVLRQLSNMRVLVLLLAVLCCTCVVTAFHTRGALPFSRPHSSHAVFTS